MSVVVVSVYSRKRDHPLLLVSREQLQHAFCGLLAWGHVYTSTNTNVLYQAIAFLWYTAAGIHTNTHTLNDVFSKNNKENQYSYCFVWSVYDVLHDDVTCILTQSRLAMLSFASTQMVRQRDDFAVHADSC